MKLTFVAMFLLAASLLAPAAKAANIQIFATNFSDYGQGMACVVDGESNGDFELVYRAADFNTDRTDRNSAIKLLQFFKDPNHGDCYRLPASGQGTLSVPDRSDVYIVVVLMSPTGAQVYWHIESVEGSIEQVVTIP